MSPWEDVLANNAQVFNGLYGGLRRICRGTAKKPEKILREWAQRTHYQWENQQVDLLCQQLLLPPIQAEDRSALESWATLLLEAAERAGICAEQHLELVLDAQTVKAYTEWNGAQLCEEDPVEILEPAWYQNGKLLEQGLCKHKGQPAKKNGNSDITMAETDTCVPQQEAWDKIIAETTEHPDRTAN